MLCLNVHYLATKLVILKFYLCKSIDKIHIYQSVTTFVYEMGYKEENVEKRRKIDALSLSDAEWGRVEVFEKLLNVRISFLSKILYILFQRQTADKAQQAFSSSTLPTLCNAVPALEKLYTTWESQRKEPTSVPFETAVTAGMEKINEYYVKTAESDSHIMAMREFFQLFL